MFSSESESHIPSMFSKAFQALEESPSSRKYFRQFYGQSARLAIKASLQYAPTVDDIAEAANVDDAHAPTVDDAHAFTEKISPCAMVEPNHPIPVVRAALETSMPARDQDRKHCLECMIPSDTAYSDSKETNSFDVSCITAVRFFVILFHFNFRYLIFKKETTSPNNSSITNKIKYTLIIEKGFIYFIVKLLLVTNKLVNIK